MIKQLGYISIGSKDLDDWTSFGSGLLGMQVAERTRSNLSLRMDDRRQRFIVDGDFEEGARCFGWEVEDAAALDRIAAAVEAAGYAVKREPRDMADRRFVADLISFKDPLGNRLEIHHGPQVTSDPFMPGRAISGFRTGVLGLGHAVLWTRDATAAVEFYQKVLGFRLSDYMTKPFRAFFFHVNPRHHSFALIEMGQEGWHHLMVEVGHLDDVGQAYDIAQQDPGRVSVTLGRHTNDYITSFYARSPSRFLVEYGWGCRSVDMEAWQAYELVDGPSFWGHDRDWLPLDKQVEAREMRMRAAANGVRAEGMRLTYDRGLPNGTCAWWDGVTQLHR